MRPRFLSHSRAESYRVGGVSRALIIVGLAVWLAAIAVGVAAWILK